MALLLIEHFKGLNILPEEDIDLKEMRLIDEFIAHNSSVYEFVKPEHKQLIQEILYKRLCNQEWLQSSSLQSLLKIMQIVRLLSRDEKHILTEILADAHDVVEVLNEILQDSSAKISVQIAEEEQQRNDQVTIDTAASIIIEALSILKRLNAGGSEEVFVSRRIFTNVIDLISVNNPLLLKTLLDFITDFFHRVPEKLKESFVTEFGQIYYIGKLLFICEKYDESFKMQAINILTKLMPFNIICDNFRRIQGIGSLIQELKKTKSLKLRLSILNCMYQLLQKTEIVYDFKVFGIVPILQEILRVGKNFMEVLLTIDILSLLIMDDDLSLKIVNSGMSSVTSFLIGCHPFRKKNLAFDDIKPEQLNEAIFELELRCFRLLRFLFSIEKNKKIFKMLFPMKLFGMFIDIGNYVKNFLKYKPLAEEFNLIREDELQKIESNLVEIEKELNESNEARAKSSTQFGSYKMVEMIGKGAFGTVYLVRKGGNKYALKKIPFSNAENFSEGKKKGEKDSDEKNPENNFAEMNESNLGEYFKEVKIYKSLKHPNIVTYYESFIEGESLCIVMEFVEGFNLSELIKVQAEKQDNFSEKQIWKVLVSLGSVLKYLHADKKIIHRDLNPANIMIDNEFNVKLADFGLAKTLNQSVNGVHSFVGTLIYSSPEVVQNKPYSQKADVWSFGCVLYELIALKPAFQSGNPLTLANKIVNLDYLSLDKIPSASTYSPELIQLVTSCLTPDEEQRPDILQILQSVTPHILTHLDALREREAILNQEVVQLTRKMNQKRATELSGIDSEPVKKPIIKIEPANLHRIEEDPVSKFLVIIQKIAFIANYPTAQKNNFKKFLVDLFYNKVILADDQTASSSYLKSELHNLLNLSKNDVASLNIKFDINQKSHQNVSYENLYFFIEELYSTFRKQSNQ